MEEPNTLSQLRQHLSGLPTGPISDAGPVEKLLAQCWDEFHGGGETSMEGYKLHKRTEQMAWNPPHLKFDLERHGGTVNGSIYAEVHSWDLDVEQKTAAIRQTKRRQLYAKDASLKIKPLAEEIANLVLKGAKDPRLTWKTPSDVRLSIGKIIPHTNNWTTSDRRLRFKAAIEEMLQPHGWRMATHWRFKREAQ